MNPIAFVHKLGQIRSFDDFMWVFDHQEIGTQILMGLVVFGILVLIWIFFVAFFIDKHK